MPYKLILIIFFYSLTANASNEATCLKVKQQQNKLTFFYTKPVAEGLLYFYAKVETNSPPRKKQITWHDVQGMTEHLLVLQNTEPKQYFFPENAKKLYIVKSLEPLDSIQGFGKPARITPADISRMHSSITKRNAGNFIRILPAETKIQHSEEANKTANICKFSL
ncbi:MAG: hypothetical protein QM500_19275 [Methylococcales bacterium]